MPHKTSPNQTSSTRGSIYLVAMRPRKTYRNDQSAPEATASGEPEPIVEGEFSTSAPEGTTSEEDGMVWENGLFVYRTGKPLPSHIVDDAIRRSRVERSKRLLDNLS